MPTKSRTCLGWKLVFFFFWLELYGNFFFQSRTLSQLGPTANEAMIHQSKDLEGGRDWWAIDWLVIAIKIQIGPIRFALIFCAPERWRPITGRPTVKGPQPNLLFGCMCMQSDVIWEGNNERKLWKKTSHSMSVL